MGSLGKLIMIYIFIARTDVLGQEECRNASVESAPQASNMNTTIIRLDESQSRNMNFKWFVKPKRKVQCRNVQRCNIMAWEAARNLEKFLSNYKVDSKNPAVVIDNKMIMSGVEYVLNLTISNGSYLSNREFVLPMNNTEATETPAAVHSNTFGTLKLLGANESFADSEYLIMAEVTPCETNARKPYLLNWELLEKDGKLIKDIDFEGNNLRLEPYTLDADREYIINCTLSSENESLNAQRVIRTLNRGLLLKLNTRSLLIGTNEPLTLIAFVKDPDHKKPEFNLEWDCNYDGNACSDFEVNTAILELVDGFSLAGTYSIMIKVSNEQSQLNETCIVTVSDEVNRTLEINEIKDVIDPTKSTEFIAKISKLVTGCLVVWESLNEDGYEVLDLDSMPGYVGLINVTVKADAFLDELEEFSNDTIDKEYSLVIPPKSDTWNGLKGGAKYLFRLNASCPTSSTNHFDLVQAEFSIQTDAIPIVESFTVNPTSGVALLTKYKFLANVEDPSLILSFGYILGNITYYFITLGGIQSAETFLPFSANGISTILKACNSRKSCSTVEGATVQVTKPDTISETDLADFKSDFSNDLNRGDYNKAFLRAINYLATIKTFDNDLMVKELETSITDAVSSVIDQLIDVEDLDKSAANSLIREVKLFSETVQLPENILLGLVKLRARMSEEMRARIVTVDETLHLQLSDILTTEDVNLEEFKEYLEVSELVILASKDELTINNEKHNLLNNIEKFSWKLCRLVYRGQKVNLELKTFNFMVEKLSTNYFKNYVTVPTAGSVPENSMKVKFSQNWFSEFAGRQMCVAKGLFSDYLDQRGNVFLVNIYGYDGTVALENSVIMNTPNPKTACSVYRSDAWMTCKRVKFNGKEQFCKCDNLGYFSLKITDDPVVESTTAISRQTHVTSTTEKSPELRLKAASTLDNGDKISIAIIAISISGMVVLAAAGVIYSRVKRKRTVETADVLQFPKYADIYHGDILDSQF